MRPTAIQFLANACGGKLLGDPGYAVTNVKIDSREANKGDMFVCVVGEFNNGHDYAEAAYQGGCRAFLMSDSYAAENISAHGDASVILADNTVSAFEKMAEAYISQFDIKRVGVTGSVGKTTTKMLTAAVLGSRFNTICTQKNLNTDLGLCLTCFLADENTQAIVFEMGMDAKGQISEYVSFIKPELAIITNVGVSHMERLGSRDAIADAKLEIVSCFNEKNTLVVNSESDYLSTEQEIRERAVNKSNFRIISAALPDNIENKGLEGVEFVLDGQSFSLPLIGQHNVVDAVLAIRAGEAFGISLKEAAAALSHVQSTERRLKAENINGITLLDDSYNASPDSMKAGLAALAAAEGKRKIAILSDMYELGDAEEEGHYEVGMAVAENNIDILIAVGENSSFYSQGVGHVKGNKCNVIELGTNLSAAELAVQLLKAGDVVLVKGSNGTKINEVAEYIRKAEL